MFRWIIGSSLRFRYVVLAVAAALIAFGTAQLRGAPVDVFPEFAPPVVQVQTEAIGLSADEVQSLITLNLEELLSGVPWLESIRSQSVTGLSSIVLTFKRGTDVIKARQMVQERLTLAYTLPNIAQPPVILQPLSATSRFLMVGITSDRVEPTELSLLARWTIKPRLLGVPGVANVAIWGQRLRQMHVQIDPNRLHDARLIQEDVITAAGDALWVSPLTFLKGSAPGTGGWIDNSNQRLGVQHSMPIETPEDIAKVPLTTPSLLLSGKAVSLGDVAELTFSHPPLIGDAVAGTEGGLLMVIEKFPSTNTLEVTRGVEEALAQLSRGLPGVKIDTRTYRLATYVDESIRNLAQAIILGGVLVVLFTGALLYSWRAALISGASITLTLLAALAALHLTGATINTMMLAGLIVALSVVIDDVVVDTQVLRERLRTHAADGGASVASVVFETTRTSQRDALYATLVVVLAVMPIFFMGGVAGSFFEPLAWAYLLAVAASMLVALTVTPVLSLMLLERGAGHGREPPAAAWLGNAYESALRRLVSSPRKAVLAAALVALAGLGILPLLGQSLLPDFKEQVLLVNWSTPAGTSHAETQRITARVSKELRSLPGVNSIAAHVGRAVTGDQVVGINASQIWVGIDPKADYDRTVAAIRRTVEGYPGVEHSVSSYLRDKVSEVLTGAGHAIVVRIYGPRMDVLNEKAEEVRKAIGDVRGLVDLRTEGQVEELQAQVRVNLDAAGRANVKPGDVRRSTATVFAGLVVGYLFKEQKIYEVVVHGAPEARQSLTNLRELWVDKSDRTQVRLGDIADVSLVPTPTILRHEQIAPYVDVVANVSGRDARSVADEIEDRLEKLRFPLEYHPELLGESAELESAQGRMLGVALAALAGIYLLLQACFGSWRLATIAFAALPAAAAGGVLAVLVTGGVVSLGSMVGFLAALGIAARNGIALVSHYQQLEAGGDVPFGPELVVRGARERLLHIVAGSVAVIVALLPIVVSGRQAGFEVVQPTAVVVIGGLLASTLVTLFATPLAYLLFGAGGRRPSDLGLAGQ